MPVIAARRRGPCAACSLPIEVGESIDYALHVGARHLACTDREAGARRNEYAMPCELCRVHLLKGQGELHCLERESAGTWRRRWVARCTDIAACNARLQG